MHTVDLFMDYLVPLSPQNVDIFEVNHHWMKNKLNWCIIITTLYTLLNILPNIYYHLKLLLLALYCCPVEVLSGKLRFLFSVYNEKAFSIVGDNYRKMNWCNRFAKFLNQQEDLVIGEISYQCHDCPGAYYVAIKNDFALC